MSERQIPIEPNVKVLIKAHKHADLATHDSQEVFITGRGAAGATIDYRQEDLSLHLEMFKEASIFLPRETQVSIQMIKGHCKVRGLSQGLTGTQIGGHLMVRDSGPIQIDHVGGHAELQSIDGILHLEHVGGHMKVGPCTGSVSALHVGGHVELMAVGGGCDLPDVGGHAMVKGVSGGQKINAGGNVITHIDPLPDLPYEIKAGGVLTCDLPSTANATIHMQGPSKGPFFRPTRTIGDGSAQVHLQARGPITLTEDGIGNHGDDVKRGIWETVRAAKVMAKSKVQEVLDENNITPETTSELQEQFSEIAEEAVEVVKEISEEVQEKVKQVWKQSDSQQESPGSTGTGTPEDLETVFAAQEEERKMILRMLSENKISVDEANDLLTTLKE